MEVRINRLRHLLHHNRRERFERSLLVIINNFQGFQFFDHTVELDKLYAVVEHIFKVFIIVAVCRNGYNNTINLLVNKGADALNFLLMRLVRLANDKVVAFFVSGFFNTGNNIRKEVLVDTRHHNTNSF